MIPGRVLITVSGSLDKATAPPVRAAIRAFREREDRHLVIDLTSAEVHGRHGMSPLVYARFVCHWSGRELYLIAPSAMVSRVLGAINGQPLPTFATLDEFERALAAEEAAL